MFGTIIGLATIQALNAQRDANKAAAEASSARELNFAVSRMYEPLIKKGSCRYCGRTFQKTTAAVCGGCGGVL